MSFVNPIKVSCRKCGQDCTLLPKGWFCNDCRIYTEG